MCICAYYCHIWHMHCSHFSTKCLVNGVMAHCVLLCVIKITLSLSLAMECKDLCLGGPFTMLLTPTRWSCTGMYTPMYVHTNTHVRA
jgi:hypothetical protein